MKKFVLASSSLSDKCKVTLTDLGFDPIVMPEYFRLQKPVSSHPDMLLYITGDKYVTTSEYYSLAPEIFEKINSAGLSPVLTDELPSPDYPHDILFNALRLGDHLFGLEDRLSEKLKDCECTATAKNPVSLVNVKQGYAKCSVCKVSDTAIITADASIERAAEKLGVDVLKISAGNVRLDGYDCGFIGGASGSTDSAVFFCGDVMSHPDGKKIAEFCKKHSKECISLSDEILFDVGTLFFL